MKKENNARIKAHLFRSGLIVFLLLALCVIPLAVAQRVYRGKADGRYGGRTPSAVVNSTGVKSSPAIPDCRFIISEGFNDITLLPGWVLINHSQPLGASDWFQGNEGVFTAFDGAPDAYIGANYYNGGGLATISNWLLTPEMPLQDGNTLTFYTRTIAGSAFPDRLQVRMSTNGSSTNVGTTATDVGDFTNLLLDINPSYATGGYPEGWTQFSITVSNVPSGSTGRLAFRYFVEDGGPEGTRSNYIGVDRVVYCGTLGVRTTPTPRPNPSPTPRPTP
jgi:hypothetical protein